ncbi:FAD-dependent oxidoreductase [Alcaligenaceae bacterium CGII-47]|nr:FAD-dependent oxidoreductase [Alcaligenaceae bacterium CGII-47]
MRPSTEFNLIVIGAGAGGMTAALIAAVLGMKVLLVEGSDKIGGTMAYSSGTAWIPGSQHQAEPDASEDAARALGYLDALVGDLADRKLREAFIANGPKMIAFLQANTSVRFQAYSYHPDYRQELPGAASGGRPLDPLHFDGRLLGNKFDVIRWPMPELTLPGGMMVTRGEAARLLNGLTSWDSIKLGITLLSRLASDRLHYKRGTRLVLGNALAARLYKSLLDQKVTIILNGRITRLIKTSGTVRGVVLAQNNTETSIFACQGVILAGGGFAANREWREHYLPKPTAQYTPAYDGCNGETIKLALAAGGIIGPAASDNALWFPCSIAQRKDGSTAVYPHIVLDRAKPGLIAVNSMGRRFTNEAASYHDFAHAMYATNQEGQSIPAALICDRRFLWKYGLGMIWPHSLSVKRYIQNGYLQADHSLNGLAAKIGVDANNLAQTVKTYNKFSKTGKDTEFGKGEDIYNRNNGDPLHQPNPCIGPIASAPYYSVRVFPLPVATSLGLKTDENANVLDESSQPIEGLYACGNDMNSAFGGQYPGGGSQIGLAMTFAYIAATHAKHRQPLQR